MSEPDGTRSRRPTPPVLFGAQDPVVREVVAFDRAVVLTEWSPSGVQRAWVSRDGGRRWTEAGVGTLLDRIRTFAIDFDVPPLPLITLTRGGYVSPSGR